jgi:hypothetical protein
MCISISEEIRRNKSSNTVEFAHVEAILVHFTINEDCLPCSETQFHLQLVGKKRKRKMGRAASDLSYYYSTTTYFLINTTKGWV